LGRNGIGRRRRRRKERWKGRPREKGRPRAGGRHRWSRWLYSLPTSSPRKTLRCLVISLEPTEAEDPFEKVDQGKGTSEMDGGGTIEQLKELSAGMLFGVRCLMVKVSRDSL
jgi:hypothetical protein